MKTVFRGIAFAILALCCAGAQAASYRVDGNRLIISGAFYTDREFDRFAAYVRDNPAVDTIVMKDFLGGVHMNGFLNVTKFIRDRKLATEVDGQCVSACALAFLGGVRRGLAPGADPATSFVAFHGLSANGKLYEPFEATFVNALRRYTGGRMPEAVARKAYSVYNNGLMMFFDHRAKNKQGISVILCKDVEKIDTCVGLKGIDALSTGVFTR